MNLHFGKRTKCRIDLSGCNDGLRMARERFDNAAYCEAFDIYEQLAAAYPQQAVSILAELYDRYRELPDRSRYALYQARIFDFGIMPGDKVLDIGSGHVPFPLATHLSDITLTDHGYGRAGVPFKHVDGKPVFECSVEELPFKDKEFDFAYCSHVLEHAQDPARACRELMRVAKRGFIECPSPGKDIFLNSAKISNHSWGVEKFGNRLIFSEYSHEQIEAFQCDILQQMHNSPRTDREKAFSALIYLKADVVNTMLLWENEFECGVRNHDAASSSGVNCIALSEQDAERPTAGGEMAARVNKVQPLRFIQVHTFYPSYLNDLYAMNPNLGRASYDEQIKMLVSDGFSGIHMFAPYMSSLGYESHLIIANNPCSQAQWLLEHKITLAKPKDWLHEVVSRQIDLVEPDVLYLSDPITFDSRFIATLAKKPTLVMGWRAANIPEGTDWRSFDVLMSSLSNLRQVALRLGAKAAEHFFPGYPVWMNERIASPPPCFDVVFSGSWTRGQHSARNRYLQLLAEAAANPADGFSLGFYLSGETGAITPEVAHYNLGAKFGVDMHAALKTGRIVLDARGTLEIKSSGTGEVIDLAGQQTANMRIFEVTGSGVFLLAEHYDNISDYFEPGVEIETFRDSAEMLRKIRYYLDHPDEREAIARRGQERCLRDYSMERRAEEFDRIIKKHLAAKSCLGNHEPRGVATLLKEASDCLLNGDVNRAFALLVQAKAMKEPVKGVDLARARCFLKMDRIMEAMEALREELRYFPDNSDARECLGSLEKQYRVHSASVEDAEFKSILQIIRPYTMLSEQRLYSLFTLAKRVCEENIPGNFVECGVAAGGSSALLAWVIKKYSRHPRKLFAFDSFSGMPQPTAEDSHQGVDAESSGWGTGTCSAPEESVREICAKLGVADVLTAVKGYFEETLPPMANWVGMIALLHMDGDWYESTRCILHNLYGRLSNDALIQVDDYGYWDGCRKAIHEFEASHSLKFDINPIDGTGVWFVKPDRFPVNPVIPSNLIAEFQQDDPVPQGFTTQMSANERFQLYYSIRTLNVDPTKVFRFIEIGSYGGGSLLLICRALNRMGIKFQGISVEPGGTPQFRHVLNLLGNSVIHVPMFSHAAVQKLTLLFSTSQPPGFILVDGDHTYQGVRQDIIDYYPLLAPGCTMLFHDWLPPLNPENRDYILHHHAGTEPGIRQACDELMVKEYECERIELPLLYPADPTQTQPQLPIIPNVFSTMCAYRKPAAC
ncbi:MAG: TylF/MycF/NovP-related O-methyltransferase [Geobacter sp.]